MNFENVTLPNGYAMLTHTLFGDQHNLSLIIKAEKSEPAPPPLKVLIGEFHKTLMLAEPSPLLRASFANMAHHTGQWARNYCQAIPTHLRE